MLWLVGAGSKLAPLVATKGANLEPATTNHKIQSARIKLNTVYLYTNNVEVYEISTSKYLHIVLSILFSVYNLTMAN